AQGRAARPVLARWQGEASREEGGSRWLGARACVVLHNPTDEPRRVTLTMPFERAQPGRRSPRLQVEGEGWAVEQKVALEGWRFERELRSEERRVGKEGGGGGA